jgi:hypothetical protein
VVLQIILEHTTNHKEGDHMSTPATPTPAPAPTLTDVADDVSALEVEFKSAYATLSTSTKTLVSQALAAAKAEGAAVFGALHSTVTK